MDDKRYDLIAGGCMMLCFIESFIICVFFNQLIANISFLAMFFDYIVTTLIGFICIAYAHNAPTRLIVGAALTSQASMFTCCIVGASGAALLARILIIEIIFTAAFTAMLVIRHSIIKSTLIITLSAIVIPIILDCAINAVNPIDIFPFSTMIAVMVSLLLVHVWQRYTTSIDETHSAPEALVEWFCVFYLLVNIHTGSLVYTI